MTTVYILINNQCWNVSNQHWTGFQALFWLMRVNMYASVLKHELQPTFSQHTAHFLTEKFNYGVAVTDLG